MVPPRHTSRYLCRCDDKITILRRPLNTLIFSIMAQSEQTWWTRRDIALEGQKRSPKWPKDPTTVLRSLKTMTHVGILQEERRGRGQRSRWRLSDERKSAEEILLNEIKQLSHVVNVLHPNVFTLPSFATKEQYLQQHLRGLIACFEQLNREAYWDEFRTLEEHIFLTPQSLLERRICAVFLSCLFVAEPPWTAWFAIDQASISVRTDFELLNLLKAHYYPDMSKEAIQDMLHDMQLNPTVVALLLTLKDHIVLLFYRDEDPYSGSPSLRGKRPRRPDSSTATVDSYLTFYDEHYFLKACAKTA